MGFLMLLLIVYFIPTMVGWRKRNADAIFVLNLLLGWTLIGWVVALTWAVSYEATRPGPGPDELREASLRDDVSIWRAVGRKIRGVK